MGINFDHINIDEIVIEADGHVSEAQVRREIERQLTRMHRDKHFSQLPENRSRSGRRSIDELKLDLDGGDRRSHAEPSRFTRASHIGDRVANGIKDRVSGNGDAGTNRGGAGKNPQVRSGGGGKK